jgi:ribosomal protein S18 acetylase RimI-like enzyme
MLWGAWRAEQLVGILRLHIQAGRTATLAPPLLVAGEPRETAVELIHRARRVAQEAGCQVLHTLLPEAQAADARLLNLGGLRHVADLLLLVGLTAQFPTEQPQLDIELRDVGQIGERRFAAVVKRTYEGSLDCPQTEGVRAIDDVLAGYRAAGPYAAERWLVASRGDKDVGCLILTAGYDSSQWDLTYLGVVPAARGAGLGVQLVRHAQWMTRCAGGLRLVVAVDAKNAPALGVYEACGFIEWNRQGVFWCAL